MLQNTTEFPAQPLVNEDCTLLTCPTTRTIFRYQPIASLAIVPLVIFGVALIGHLVLGIKHRTWAFMGTAVAFCLAEIGGYGARYLAHNNPFKKDYYLAQIVMLTIAPVFICAGMYICLGRIIAVYGAGVSRLAPQWYTRIFVTCDVISLIAQAAGGAITSSADTQDMQDIGVKVMLGGLGFQVATLAAFSVLGLEFAWRVRTHASVLNPETYEIRKTWQWKGFIAAVVFIIVRSTYRVAEMAEGYDGALQSNQWTFLVFEGVCVMIATGVLIVFHPGVAFGTFWNISKKVKLDSEDGYMNGLQIPLQPISPSRKLWSRKK